MNIAKKMNRFPETTYNPSRDQNAWGDSITYLEWCVQRPLVQMELKIFSLPAARHRKSPESSVCRSSSSFRRRRNFANDIYWSWSPPFIGPHQARESLVSFRHSARVKQRAPSSTQLFNAHDDFSQFSRRWHQHRCLMEDSEKTLCDWSHQRSNQAAFFTPWGALLWFDFLDFSIVIFWKLLASR